MITCKTHSVLWTVVYPSAVWTKREDNWSWTALWVNQSHAILLETGWGMSTMTCQLLFVFKSKFNNFSKIIKEKYSDHLMEEKPSHKKQTQWWDLISGYWGKHDLYCNLLHHCNTKTNKTFTMLELYSILLRSAIYSVHCEIHRGKNHLGIKKEHSSR